MSLPVRPDPASPPPPDPDARPRSLAERLGLLVMLVALPMAVVTLPTLVITGVFGQRPRPKTSAAADTSGLRRELDSKASHLLPPPAPLAAEPVRVSVHDPSHVGPRAEKVDAQAKALGGSAVEGLAAEGEKHLFVDLPAGAAEPFRRAVTENTPVESLSPSPASGSNPSATRDQVEVFIRAAGNDE